MPDNQVLNHIKNLTAREEHLYSKGDLTAEEVKNLHQIQTDLDQCWDLLRQRRALRDAGEDPSNAEIRSKVVIKNYVR